MKTADLLDLARSRAGIPSDYALAKRLQVTRQVVSGWRTGYAWPNNLMLFELAKLSQLDPGQVVAEIEHHRAELDGKADQARAWRELLTKPAHIAASVLLAVGFVASPDAHSMGQIPHSEKLANPPSVYYVNRRKRRALTLTSVRAAWRQLHAALAVGRAPFGGFGPAWA